MSDETKRPPGADDHYRDAAYYDHAYARYKPDFAHYVRLAEMCGGPILELGAGTGRITLAVAEHGIEAVGVELMDSMRERAEARLKKKPRRIRECVTYLPGDLRSVRLDRRFSAVIAPFNVFQHLYSRQDIEAGLETVRAHLAEGALFAFDVLNPEPRALGRDPNRFYKCRPIRHPRDGRRYAYSEAFRYDAATQVHTTVIRLEDPDDESVTLRQWLPQRQFFPQELRALLHYNGFEVMGFAGGFKNEPLDEESNSIVVVARTR